MYHLVPQSWYHLLVLDVLFFNVVQPAARKTEVGSAVSSAAALSCGETAWTKLIPA